MRKHLFTLVIVFVLCLGLLSGFYYETDEYRDLKLNPPISSEVLEERLISSGRSIGSFALDSSGKVALNSGSFTSWYDRLDLSGAVDSAGTNYAQRLHSWFLENSGYQNPDGVLANPIYSGWQTSGDVVLLNGGAIYAHPIAEFVGTVGFTYTHTGDAAIDEANANGAANAALDEVMSLKMDEVLSYASAVFYALDRDNVWNFWIDGQLYCGVGASGGYSYGGGSGELSYTVTAYTYLYASDLDIRAETYRETSADVMANSGLATEMSALDNTVEQLFTSRLSGDETRYELVEMIHDTLVNINCYNSADDINSIPHACRTVIGGLGGTGINAPVCEGYARAFKLLCDICDIPCVLVDGMANGESHMWNYVQMENGNWYAVDATWDDPTMAGISDPVSGYENRDYFLVGSTTVIDGLSFSASHVLANNPSPTAPGFVNGPALSPTAYEPGEGEACGDNLTWVFDEATGTLTISGTGDMWDFDDGGAPWHSLRTKITNVVIESGATSIGDNAFRYCAKLEGISLPDGLASIGWSAFNGCSKLVGIDIPEDVTNISGFAFYECSNLTSVIIPDRVTSIKDYTFYNCISLVNISVPDGVTSIGWYAFYGCGSLKSFVIPNGVTKIELSTFYGCSSLTEVVIPYGVTNIGVNAFNGCSSLTNVVIPNSVASIGGYAFSYCTSLVNVDIPEGVTSIGEGAFCNCISLESVVVPESIMSISENTFRSCSSLANIVIPDSVTSIGNSAFRECSSLAGIVIPDSVTSIGGHAFSGCSSLASVVIPNSVTSIGDRAFNSTKTIYFEGDAPGVYDNATANRSFHTDATLYYIPGTTGWTDSEYYDAEAGTWNGYKLEIWLERYDCEAYGHVYDDMYDLICNACGHERPIPSVPMFRMYDPNSGEHFYTGSEKERDFLVNAGWNYEGVAFNFPVIGDPVYRLYNPVTGDHLYTMDLDERAKLLDEGWNDEGVAFNSATSDCVPQYRLWNPNAVRGAWHFTGSERERDFLMGLGWQYQGIGWYSMLQ